MARTKKPSSKWFHSPFFLALLGALAVIVAAAIPWILSKFDDKAPKVATGPGTGTSGPGTGASATGAGTSGSGTGTATGSGTGAGTKKATRPKPPPSPSAPPPSAPSPSAPSPSAPSPSAPSQEEEPRQVAVGTIPVEIAGAGRILSRMDGPALITDFEFYVTDLERCQMADGHTTPLSDPREFRVPSGQTLCGKKKTGSASMIVTLKR